MDQKVIEKVCSQVYRQFPEVRGIHPKVKSYSGTSKLLVFNGTSTTANGKKIPRTVRVVVENDGNIKKITTSR